MQRRPTIKDVAELANVSIGTVSKVINDAPTVHPVIRRTVMAAISELGYRPNPIARSFQRGRTNAIGFVVADLSIASYLDAVPIAQELARERGYTLVVADSQLDQDIEAKNLTTLTDLRVSGILWRPILPLKPLDHVELSHTPVVAFMPPNELFPSVSADTQDSMRDAVEDLIDNGHRCIGMAFLTGASSDSLTNGFSTLISDEGGATSPGHSFVFSSREHCREALTMQLKRKDRPSALIIGSAVLSAALLAASDIGLAIPQDLSVVSVGDSELAQTFIPHISTIVFDRTIETQLAINMLFDMIEERGPDRRSVTYQTSYVRRQSVSSVSGGS